ncbi:hypothetical protein EIK77_005933 [Talaromyces pinophilus]|nr:hypothetical protein EIK77_005933 [Talaromyces pinophilus]
MARTTTLLTNLNTVLARISAASSTFPTTSTSTTRRHRPANKPVRLVAVSKLKPASDILALYSPSSLPEDETSLPSTTTTTTTTTTSIPSATQQLHFGENYFQELLEKSRVLPRGIKWHFIGGLQSNKCASLARDVRGLWAVESVDTEKKAKLLDKGWGERDISSLTEEERQQKLRVFVQVNTSGEEAKSGVEPAATPALCRYIREQCPRLKLQGLMTIGAIARSKESSNENADFVSLIETRQAVVESLGMTEQEADDFELSMGMSSDFEGAIALGSDQVRVGTTIFGERPKKAGANAGSTS